MTDDDLMERARQLATMACEYFENDDEEFEHNFTCDIATALADVRRETLAECEDIAANHCQFCAAEAHNGGAHELYERASGAAHIRDKIHSLHDKGE